MMYIPRIFNTKKDPIHIFTYSGISVALSPWMFIVLSIVAAYTSLTSGIGSAMMVVGYLGLVYFFVLVHEFGHALSAQRYKIPVKSIVLYPLSGLATIQIDSRYNYPKRDFWITAWGPLTNVGWCFIFGSLMLVGISGFVGSVLIPACFAINLVLLLFNLLPIFPMDGGRILKSILMMCGMHAVKSAKVTYYTGLIVGVPLAIFAFLNGSYMVACILTFFSIFHGKNELKRSEKIDEHQQQNKDFIRGGSAEAYPKKTVDVVRSSSQAAEQARDLLRRTAKYDRRSR